MNIERKLEDYIKQRKISQFNERRDFINLISSGTDKGKQVCLNECSYLFGKYKIDKTYARYSIKTHPFTLFFLLVYTKFYTTIDIDYKTFLTSCTITIDTTVTPWKCGIIPPNTYEEMNEYTYSNLDRPENIKVIMYYIDDDKISEKMFITKENIFEFLNSDIVRGILHGIEPHDRLAREEEEERLREMASV